MSDEAKKQKLVWIVIDTETTGLDPDKDRVVEISAVRWQRGQEPEVLVDTLVNPGIPIPPVASAIHHITDPDVVGAPLIGAVIDEIKAKIPPDADPIFCAHNAAFDRSMLPDLAHHRWLCTMRLAMHLWPTAPGHGNQVLRYWRKLEVPKDTPTHRAFGDILVTGRLLENEVAAYRAEVHPVVDPQAILEFADSPLWIYRMPFGKHRDWPVHTIPASYMRWALANASTMSTDLRATLERIQGNDSPPSWAIEAAATEASESMPPPEWAPVALALEKRFLDAKTNQRSVGDDQQQMPFSGSA